MKKLILLSLLTNIYLFGHTTNRETNEAIKNNTNGIQVLANNIAILNQEVEYQHSINIEQEKLNNKLIAEIANLKKHLESKKDK